MSIKPVVRRARADQDLLEAVERDLQEAGDRVALRFVDAVEKAFRHIAHHPESGASRYALELELPGIRCWPIMGTTLPAMGNPTTARRSCYHRPPINPPRLFGVALRRVQNHSR